MNASWAVVVAVDFVWLGMMLGISFLEAPLKFRAPGVTVPVGLGIGRLVFRAFNIVEVVFAVVVLIAVLLRALPGAVSILIAVAALLLQLAVVRPRLNRRTEAVLAGQNAPGSRGHLAYIGLELVKALALFVSGVLLLTA